MRCSLRMCRARRQKRWRQNPEAHQLIKETEVPKKNTKKHSRNGRCRKGEHNQRKPNVSRREWALVPNVAKDTKAIRKCLSHFATRR